MRAMLVLSIVTLPLLGQQPEKKFPAKPREEILKTFVDEFVLLTPGQGKYPATFLMGGTEANEKPTRRVAFARPFAIAKYEVTQELYLAVMGTNPSKWKGHRNAVELVTWHEANEFCVKATAELRKLQLLQGEDRIRLPSEAEWEYACRAGTSTAWSHGDGLAELGGYCWYKDNSKGHDPPVGLKKANPWGLYDMHGYNWEWVADSWHPNYEGAPSDGRPWQDAGAKDYVIRGGSWADPADAARSAFRKKMAGGEKNDKVGFRCVLAP